MPPKAAWALHLGNAGGAPDEDDLVHRLLGHLRVIQHPLHGREAALEERGQPCRRWTGGPTAEASGFIRGSVAVRAHGWQAVICALDRKFSTPATVRSSVLCHGSILGMCATWLDCK